MLKIHNIKISFCLKGNPYKAFIIVNTLAIVIHLLICWGDKHFLINAAENGFANCE